jgi:flagellar hook-associated protein 3 FlgL
MSVSGNVSFLSQTMSQISRLKDLRVSLDDLQRQVTTQKKFDNYGGYGTDSLNLQFLRTTETLTESYIGNIDTVSNRMEMMSNNMTQISKLGNQLLSAVHLGGATDVSSINPLAQQNLQFVKDLVNQTLDGRYLFGGSDAENPPFVDESTLNSNFINQVNLWLGGGGNAQLTGAMDGFSADNLGLSPGLANAGALTARISHNMDIDYTVKADQPGFQDIIRGLAFFANLKYPDPAAGDLATPAEFDAALKHGVDVLTRGVQEMNDAAKQLVGKVSLMKDIKESHKSDMELLLTQIDGIENMDPSSAIITMQLLQNQLTASYQVTKIVGQLSLVNFL